MSEQTTDLVVRADQNGRLESKQIAYIASTDFVPKSYRGNLPAIMACIQTGRELGLGDLEALRSINVIDGRPSLSAELMVKLARAKGHSITGEVGEGSATLIGTRGDNGDTLTVTWTHAMAQRAGLVNKDNWKKYPEAMLWARAASQLCRMLFPDAMHGLSHTGDEVELSPEARIEERLATTALPFDAGPDDTFPEVIEGEVLEPEPEPDDIDFGKPGGHLDETVAKLTDQLIALAETMGKREQTEAAINANRAKNTADLEAHAAWLAAQLDRAQAATS